MSLKKIIKDAPSHREVARQLADLARQMESSLGKVSPQPDDETIAQGIAPLEVLAKKMKTIPKTADQRVKYDWDVRPLVDGQIDKLRQDIEAEGNFRYQQCEKIIQATTPFLNKYTSRPDADGSWNFSSPIQKATSSLMGSGNKLCKQGK